jgi:hypothetical protein
VNFIYRERTHEQWLKRASKKAWNALGKVVTETAEVSTMAVPEPMPVAEIVNRVRQAKGKLKVSASGHLQLSGESIPQELFATLQARREEVTAFLLSQKKVKTTAVVLPTSSDEFVETRTPYLRCRECGHFRSQHCTKRKLKAGQVLTDANWKGFIDASDQIQPCSHTLPDAKPYACDSGACAAVLGSGDDAHYCPCKKFISPLAKKKAAKSRTTPLPDGMKHEGLIAREALLAANRLYLQEQDGQAEPKVDKAKVLLEVVREDRTLTIAQLTEASGMSPSWLRKHLRLAGLMAPAKPRERKEKEKAREQFRWYFQEPKR